MKKSILTISILILFLTNNYLLKAQTDTLELYMENSVKLTLITDNINNISELNNIDSLYRAFVNNFKRVEALYLEKDKKNNIYYKPQRTNIKAKKTFFNKKKNKEISWNDKLNSITVKYQEIEQRKCFIENENYITSDKFLHSLHIEIDAENTLIFYFNNLYKDFEYLEAINIDEILKDIDKENKNEKFIKRHSYLCKYQITDNKLISDKILINKYSNDLIEFYPSFGLWTINGEFLPNVAFNLGFITRNNKRERTFGITFNNFYYFDKTRNMVEFYPYFGIYRTIYNVSFFSKVSTEIAYSPKETFYTQSNFLKPNSIYLNIMAYLTRRVSVNLTWFHNIDAKDPETESNTFIGIGFRFTFL